MQFLHREDVSFLTHLSSATFSHLILLHLLSTHNPHLAFFPWASLSVSQSAHSSEKGGEVNSLSLDLINNVTQKLTEWVWMAATGVKCPKYFLNYSHRYCPPLPTYCPPSLQHDLFNLGDRFLSDPVLCLFRVCCYLTEFFSCFLCITPGVIAEQEKCFLVKEPCNRITLHMCFSVERVCVCACAVGCSAQRLHTHANKAMLVTCIWRPGLCETCSCLHVDILRIHAWPCLQMFGFPVANWCTHSTGCWVLQFTAGDYREGLRRALLCCNWAAHGRGLVGCEGEWRFPVLPMLLGVKSSVKY